ncbi:MAG: hypothetical protein FWD71_15665 [Oscillospiraceae bacterium]|nr:hypothetical protein [Oscillospiraceae bacterium]
MSGSKKPVIAIATALTAAVLLTTGTFALNQISGQGGEFIGQSAGVILHDDCNPDTGVKDVYVENVNPSEMFVRVKLEEAMNLDSNTWRPDATDWTVHTYGTSDADCGHSDKNGEQFHEYFTWEMGGQKYYMPSDGSKPVVQNSTLFNGTEPGIKLTPDAQIVSIDAYLSMDSSQKAIFTGWIYGSDGYEYWSQPLKQSEATGLLLHKVTTSESLTGTNYYYAINVKVEAADINGVRMWTQDPAALNGGIADSAEAKGGTEVEPQ